ncbi:formate dehydrogenase accessory sulfurtransferase FdhD [Faunimonas pinastri]|uniref:formate dehydrogenase accessory sulfurtransferase FdhD n=1 Tax=Faunimonas pinastri TaxID=1855383 RepID=UPI000B870CE9|nr:formate dehydrogenase accessory sulfurtransferase FdhD [Faunimonas pinastri]
MRVVRRDLWRDGVSTPGERGIPEETATALTYNAASFAVMMATPRDLEDFALGFSLTEKVVGDAGEIEALDIVESEAGVELRMWVPLQTEQRLSARRRQLAGPTGCGLCGIDSLMEAVRAPPRVESTATFTSGDIAAGLDALASGQALHRETRAVHGAAFWRPGRGLVAIREDVGRHNALDKLVGALARSGEHAGEGLLVMTSRVSVELVQKAAVLGAPVMVAVSAPTALAVRTAEAAGITLVASARGGSFEVFTHPGRLSA